jgi:hypothetical protein
VQKYVVRRGENFIAYKEKESIGANSVI